MKRYRDKEIDLYLNDVELKFLHDRIRELNYESANEYFRKAALQGALFDGEITKVYEGIQEVISEFNKIDVNINQIASQVEKSNPKYKKDIEQIQRGQENIWRILERKLLDTPYKI